jgi:hypothetical protein
MRYKHLNARTNVSIRTYESVNLARICLQGIQYFF